MSKKEQKIKCVVWDLDNTIWQGVLLEDKQVKLNNHVVAVMHELDNSCIYWLLTITFAL